MSIHTAWVQELFGRQGMLCMGVDLLLRCWPVSSAATELRSGARIPPDFRFRPQQRDREFELCKGMRMCSSPIRNNLNH